MHIDPDEIKKYFECGCGTHLISMSVDAEDREVYMSFWELGHGGNRTSWKERLRHIWRIIRTGEPYADSIVFSTNEFVKFKDFVNELADAKSAINE
jgi:hypothetical protein